MASIECISLPTCILQQIRRVCAGSDTSEGREVYVLHDDVLQKWLISEPGLETVSLMHCYKNHFSALRDHSGKIKM